ncbi:MAG: hypothetical protein HOM11_09790 [Methylococcales bacterium]|jgi:hypothetical protein|nr:hypothetical protein [Methylococcales bacterium]MBT7444993.1 hypothetical protein [Methylococcales bacterium]
MKKAIYIFKKILSIQVEMDDIEAKHPYVRDENCPGQSNQQARKVFLRLEKSQSKQRDNFLMMFGLPDGWPIERLDELSALIGHDTAYLWLVGDGWA